MATINDIKEKQVTDTPLLLFECQLHSGAIERWGTHRATVQGEIYHARVVRHNLFDIRAAAEEGADAITRLSLTLANADSHFSQLERSIGWKHSKLTVRFAFFDLAQGIPASNTRVLFFGIANPPDEITESEIRLTFLSRTSMQRAAIPSLRVQKRCPWIFPATGAEREEALTGGNKGRYSPFYACGYSADLEGGFGNLAGGLPYTSCNYTRTNCEERGMFSSDTRGTVTNRFGGLSFVPASILVRGHGEKESHSSAIAENATRYNEVVPLVYGAGWLKPLITFSRNDGNLTRLEVLLAHGVINNVIKVVVNDIEIPQGRAGTNMTATGWFNVVSWGWRTGGFNPDFTNPSGVPLGDPHGSMVCLSVVVPNRVSDGKTLPRMQVLLEGHKLPIYDTQGEYVGDSFTNNPAWVLMDLLRRSGWLTEELDLPSFARVADFCNENIDARDSLGNVATVRLFESNLVLKSARSAGELIRGVRAASRIYMSPGEDGKLRANIEGSLGQQQPTKPPGSNSTEALGGGWPSYEFGDGSNAFGGLLRKDNGEPALRLWSKPTADSPNRYVLEFQDSLNGYQQDSLSLIDVDDVTRVGQEITGSLPCRGIPNFSQAARVAATALNKSVRGNTFVTFETSFRAIHLAPGDIITLTYLKEGFDRQPFRILKIAPSLNYSIMQITAQIHDDGWYEQGGTESSDGIRRAGMGSGAPRPLVGTLTDGAYGSTFAVSESAVESTDGTMRLAISAEFVVPRRPGTTALSPPLVNLTPVLSSDGGAIVADQSLYYAVTAVDDQGDESEASFIVHASIPEGPDTWSVTIRDLSLPPGAAAFHIYRGLHPGMLLRIADSQPPAATYSDVGIDASLVSLPDENFDHANFYWRLELQPDVPCNMFGQRTIGNSTLHMLPNEYRGKVVRVMSGVGKGQESAIASNTGTELTILNEWIVVPDSTSSFAVVEPSWIFGCSTIASPAVFEVPNYRGAAIHISGRSANANDRECAADLSPIARYVIGGAGAGGDEDVPGEPTFGISVPGDGTVEVSGIAFESLLNTITVSAATINFRFYNELNGLSTIGLATSIGDADTSIELTSPTGAEVGSIIQVESELMRVLEIATDGTLLSVSRGDYSSSSEGHEAGSSVWLLERKTAIAPFPKQFFGTPASGSYAFPFRLPNVRLVAVELAVTNARGSSSTAVRSFTGTVDRGLRTMAGGQYSFQIEGTLAVQTDAVPPVVIDETRSVRDIFAVVGVPATGSSIELRLREGSTEYCSLVIPEGMTTSNVVAGSALQPLPAGAQISLDVTSVGLASAGSAGSNLTVVIRL